MDLKNRHATEFARMYAVYVSQVLLTGFLQTRVFNHSGFQLWQTVLLTAFSTYSYVLIGLIVALHYCLVRISTSLLLLNNQEITKIVRLKLTFPKTFCALRLRQRSRLLWVCNQQLSSDFGLVLVPIMAFLLFSAPAAPFYLITIIFRIDALRVERQYLWHALPTMLLWNLPILVAILMTLHTDVVGRESSATIAAVDHIHYAVIAVERVWSTHNR